MGEDSSKGHGDAAGLAVLAELAAPASSLRALRVARLSRGTQTSAPREPPRPGAVLLGWYHHKLLAGFIVESVADHNRPAVAQMKVLGGFRFYVPAHSQHWIAKAVPAALAVKRRGVPLLHATGLVAGCTSNGCLVTEPVIGKTIRSLYNHGAYQRGMPKINVQLTDEEAIRLRRVRRVSNRRIACIWAVP